MTSGHEPGRGTPEEGLPDRVAGELAEEMELGHAEPEAETYPTMSEQIAQQLGGMRGLLESSVPVLAFVLLNFILGGSMLDLPRPNGLYIAIAGSVGTAVLIGAFRLLRRESVRHAVNGVVGIALGAYLAYRSGDARDFYLPGILLTLGQAVVLVVSVFFRKPIIGYIWAVMVNQGRHDWLDKPALHRTFQWLTLAWAGSLVFRGGSQGLLYLADQGDLIGVVRILVSWPMYAAMLALTVWAVRRVQRVPEGDEAEPVPAPRR
ncbi:DUF3159 domain-containing protein [Mangrovihabitans endophyticus]|uniref:Membrane protein n=1 Tax=Mangrovihabitans endophyticus TaxID=1751298 RepID=A0A8J3C627_9ACTN|nr:DUF3159 domain-containing protein [Mangrovihabitans endophyticus]GGL13999.1 membrane protein [Mangrovihabitans endophyticus]